MNPTLPLLVALLLAPLAASTSHAAESERPATHFSTFAQAALRESPLLNRIKMETTRVSVPLCSLLECLSLCASSRRLPHHFFGNKLRHRVITCDDRRFHRHATRAC